MRILALGGAGAVCQHAVRDLAAFGSFDQLTVADYNLTAADELVRQCADERISARRVDASDYQALVQLVGEFDLVLNGLPFKYDLAVTRACVETGVSGLDVSTEPDQWSLDEAAKEKGIVFVPGVGATPGITNLMARKGADHVDRLDEVRIYFAAFRCIAPAPGLLTTFLWEFDPQIDQERVYYQDGKFHPTGPFEGIERVNFPGPIGDQEVCYIPHPETRTLPKSLGARAVSVRGCFPPHAMQLARTLLAAGFYGRHPIRVHNVEITPFELMHQVLLQLPESRQNPLWAYGLVVEVTGERQGREVKITYWNRHPPQEEWGGPAAYYKNIAIPLSIGIQLLARGEVKTTGVVPPELVFDPEVFFQELGRRGIEIHERVEEYRRFTIG